MTNLLGNLGALWNLALLIVVAGTLLWFVYWFFVRRFLRARRIASARDRRMLREAAQRQSDDRL
jgi:hypothetical protein